MSTLGSLLLLDARGVARDNVMTLNVGLSVVVMAVITVIGAFKGNDPAWVAWFPFLIAMTLISGPPAWGFLFGLLMVDEKDTGVRSALAATPVPPTRMLLVRMVLSFSMLTVWPILTISIMETTWHAIGIPLSTIAILALAGAPFAPLTALATACFSSNKVEALAVFKGVNFLALAPLALYFIPADAAWRVGFLIAPPAWLVFAYDAFRAGDFNAGLAYAGGAFVIFSLLLALTARRFLQILYRTSD